MKKLIYRLASLGLSVVSGMLAGVMFKQLWKLIAREDEAPEATDPERSWREVLPAAALQGAVFATVKAAVERSAYKAGAAGASSGRLSAGRPGKRGAPWRMRGGEAPAGQPEPGQAGAGQPRTRQHAAL